MYGQIVNLSFQGEETFKSSIGAIMTVFIISLILFYSVSQAVILFQGSNMTTVSNKYVPTINYSNPEMIQINEFGFDLMFAITKPMTPDIGTLGLYMRVLDQIPDSTESTLTFTELETIKCGTNNYTYFNYSDKSELSFKEFDSYFCLKNKS